MEVVHDHGPVAGPLGTFSKCAANGARSLLTTITFLGEQLDTTDPPRRRDGKWILDE
jgi:hypothetical protein